MSGYFSNIAATRPAGPPAPSRIRPSIRSRSPVAERDQRLAVSDEVWSVDSAPGNNTNPISESINSEAPPQSQASPLNAPKVSMPSPDAADAASTLEQLQGRSLPTYRRNSNPTSAAERSPKRKDSIDQSRSATEPAVAAKLNASGRRTAFPVEDLGERLKQPTRRPAEKSEIYPPFANANRTIEQAGHPTPDSFPPPATQTSQHASPSFPRTPDPLHAESRRQTTRTSQPTESIQPAPLSSFDTPRSTARNSAPRIVIDRLNIEVVPPKPAAFKAGEKTANKQTNNPRPLSQIGSLSNVSKTQALSLRYR